MTAALLVGLVVVAGAPWVFVAVLLLGVIKPWIGLVAVAVVVLRNRVPAPQWSLDVRFCRGVADELRGGASLRVALAVAAEEVGEAVLARACRIGRPYDEVANAVESFLPIVGLAAGAAIRIGGESGGRVADSFEALAGLAIDEQESRDEQRSATAQVRASAFVIAVLPLILVAGLAATGRLGLLIAGGGLSIGLMFIGLCLLTAGLFAIWWMVRRAEAT